MNAQHRKMAMRYIIASFIFAVLVGFALLGYMWIELLLLAAALLVLGRFNRQVDAVLRKMNHPISSHTRTRLTITAMIVVPVIVVVTLNANGVHGNLVGAAAFTTAMTMWWAYRKVGIVGRSTNRTFIVAASIVTACALFDHFVWWYTAVFAGVVVTTRLIWLLLRPVQKPSRLFSVGIELKPAVLNPAIVRYSDQSEQMMNPLACQRKHWAMAIKDVWMAGLVLAGAVVVDIILIRNDVSQWVPAVLTIGAVAFTLERLSGWLFTFHVLTEERLYWVRAFPIKGDTKSLSRVKVSNMSTSRTVPGKLLDYYRLAPGTVEAGDDVENARLYNGVPARSRLSYELWASKPSPTAED